MISVDQLGVSHVLKNNPKRVISLVPSITELLIDIDVEVVGRTKFCVHPAEYVKHIPIIGGTKNFRFDQFNDLKPDLIIGNKEENYPEGIDRLRKEYPVWMSDIQSFSDSIQAFDEISQVVGRVDLWQRKRDELLKLYEKIKNSKSGRVLYLIWEQPYMGAGKNTYIDGILTHMGYQNVLVEDRYPAISLEMIQQISPELLLLSSEPFPFKQKHIKELETHLPNTKIQLVNGEFYSWYGTRILKLAPNQSTGE